MRLEVVGVGLENGRLQVIVHTEKDANVALQWSENLRQWLEVEPVSVESEDRPSFRRISMEVALPATHEGESLYLRAVKRASLIPV